MADETTEHADTSKIAHRGTYDAFMSALKWGVAIVAIVLIMMAIFLA